MTKTSVFVLLAGLLMAGSAMAGPTVYRHADYQWLLLWGWRRVRPDRPMQELSRTITGGNGPSFQSFCLEKSRANRFLGQDLQTSSLNDEAVQGGDQLRTRWAPRAAICWTQRTAYLYTRFRAGTLTGYDYTVPGPGRLRPGPFRT